MLASGARTGAATYRSATVGFNMAIPLSKKMIATELTLRSTSSYMVMDLLGPALKVKVEAM